MNWKHITGGTSYSTDWQFKKGVANWIIQCFIYNLFHIGTVCTFLTLLQ